MKQFLIAAVVILVGFLIYYTLTRRLIEKFIDSDASSAAALKKVLIDETDIPELAAGRTIHEVLMEKDLKFLEEQLEIYGKTRSIINKIVAAYANASRNDDSAAAGEKGTKEELTEKALQAISKETFGESPRFCSAGRVKELLESPAADGLGPLFKCLPRDPSRYLLLLSFASKALKGQLDSVQGILGLQKGSADADDLPPPSEVELSGSRRPMAEGFAESATSSSLSADAYISAYAIPNPPNSASASASATASASASDESSADDLLIENELKAWKSAFNTESMTRIKQYLKYCTAALKDIDEITKAGQDGSLIKKLNMDKVRDGVAAQLQNRMSSSSANGSGSLNLPF